MKRDRTLRLGGIRSEWILSLIVLLAALTLGTVARAVEVGEKAPDFTLPSTKGDPISLSQFLGKKNVVIEFYVLDFTPT